MNTEKIGTNLFIVDLKTGGFQKLIASYILKGEKTIIVETGPTSSIPNLLSGLKELNIRPGSVDYVALTHIHLDHAGGVGTLIKYLPNAKVVVHSKGASHLKDPAKLWEASKKTLGEVANVFGEPTPVSEDKIIVAHEGMILDAGRLKLGVVETAGHASHNLSYFEERDRGVFPGDAAGAYFSDFNSIFPTTPPPFRPDIALKSLEKLINLNPKFLYYSHFGKASDALKRLRDYQAQIKKWLSIVQEALGRGYDKQSIIDIVLKEDDSIRELVPKLRANPVHNRTLIKNSVEGFIDYIKNSQI